MSIHDADRLYKPRAGTLPHRVVEWFAANLEEELTTGDIADKFDPNARNRISAVLNPSVRTGLLIAQRGSDGNTYSAGPRLLSGEYPEPDQAAAPAAKAAPAIHIPAAADRPAIVIHVHVHIDGRPHP